MIGINEATYIVTDVETTGSNTSKNRMTEIACVTLRDGKIVSQYSSLVNPHQAIPPYVAKMTGISQSMVSSAPEESEIIDTVKSLFPKRNGVFAAHNVAFDYSFVSNFFKRGFVHFEYPQLCTLKLARKMLPREIKKNVGDLAAYFGIRMKNRHRALIDARSTALILSELLYIAETEHNITKLSDLLQFQNKSVLHYRISRDNYSRIEDQIRDLPYNAGLFRFLDAKGNTLYWDFAFNLNQKINSIFNDYYFTSKPLLEMAAKINKIAWEVAESELAAIILRDKLRKQQLNKSTNNTISLFEDRSSSNNLISDSDSFVYIQAQNNNEKIVDLYIVSHGKLHRQMSIGRKAHFDNLKLRIKESFTDNYQETADYTELSTINKWIDMQNDTGLVIEATGKDHYQIFEEVQNSISLAFEISTAPGNNDFYF